MTFPFPTFIPATVQIITVVDAKGTQSTANATTYSDLDPGLTGSFTGCLLMVGTQGTASRTVSSLTVNGNAATYLGRQTAGSQTLEIWGIATTVCNDVDVTWSGACNNMGLDVVAFTGANDPTTATDTAASTADPAALAIDVQAGGLIAGGVWFTNSGTLTWTNATEFTDRVIETTVGMSSAYNASATAQTGLAVEANYSSPNVQAAFAVAIR